VNHEVIVVGGGPAGTSAATALAARGVDVALIDPLGLGGRLVNIDVLRDCPGPLAGAAGWDLAATLGEAAMTAGVVALFGQAERVEAAGGRWRVTVDGDDHEATAVLLATGCRNRPVPGDETGALVGRGVSYCAVCDAQLFAGRSVVVAGSGDWARAEVLTLAPLVASVVWVDPASAGSTTSMAMAGLDACDNVRWLPHSELIAVRVADSVVRAVEVVQHGPAGGSRIVQTAGVFGADATLPNSGPVAAIGTCDEDGFVHTDAALACPGRPGLYAAGDVRRGARRSVTTAMADGIAAAAAIADYVHDARR
jgi:thioredoxin reductase (NADPH)